MAGMMMFDNAGTFNQGYANGLAGLAFKSQGDKRQGALAKLAGVDANAAFKLKAEFDDQDKADFAEFSKVMLTVPDDIKPQVYAKGVQRFGQKFQAMGFEPPQDYTQVMPLFEQAAGVGAVDTPADVRSNEWYMKQLGYAPGSKEANDFLRMRAGQMPKAVPYGFKYDDYGNAFVEDRNKGTLGAAGTAQMPQQQSGVQLTSPDGETIDYNSMSPDDKAAYNLLLQNPGVGQTVSVRNGQVISSSLGGQPARIGVKPDAPKSQSRPMSAQEIANYGLPAGTSATIDSNGTVNVLNKPAVEPKKQADANVVKQAAQLPSLLRRIQRVADASGKLGFAGVDGGPIDQVALKYSPSGQELESAVGQLRAMLLPFVRVPGVGSQSDLEARLDSLQYPDASQPPAVRKRNIDELNAFVKDLSNVYTTMINGSTPSAPVGNDDDLINKYLSK